MGVTKPMLLQATAACIATVTWPVAIVALWQTDQVAIALLFAAVGASSLVWVWLRCMSSWKTRRAGFAYAKVLNEQAVQFWTAHLAIVLFLIVVPWPGWLKLVMAYNLGTTAPLVLNLFSQRANGRRPGSRHVQT